MKAVILCAGKGTRLKPLTEHTPKGLVLVKNKPLLEYTLDVLEGEVDEVIFVVVGHLGEKIQEHFGSKRNGISFKYAWQKELKGSGQALLCAKPFLNGNFIVLNGDDIYDKKDIKRVLSHKHAVLAKYVEDPSAFGVFLDTNGYVEKLVEKPKEKISNYANIGVYVMDESIFDYELPLSPRGEYEIVDYITYLAQRKPMKIVQAQGQWLPVNSFEQKDFAESVLSYLEL